MYLLSGCLAREVSKSCQTRYRLAYRSPAVGHGGLVVETRCIGLRSAYCLSTALKRLLRRTTAISAMPLPAPALTRHLTLTLCAQGSIALLVRRNQRALSRLHPPKYGWLLCSSLFQTPLKLRPHTASLRRSLIPNAHQPLN